MAAGLCCFADGAWASLPEVQLDAEVAALAPAKWNSTGRICSQGCRIASRTTTPFDFLKMATANFGLLLKINQRISCCLFARETLAKFFVRGQNASEKLTGQNHENIQVR